MIFGVIVLGTQLQHHQGVIIILENLKIQHQNGLLAIGVMFLLEKYSKLYLTISINLDTN